jgi:alanyl-tRNA synthetase
MKTLTGNEIRSQFVEFFRKRGHTVVPSAPLIPERDPSLLFINAGMVPFKNVFIGTETRPYTRAVDAQKCLRVSGKHNDLEDVGRDDYHHTFFEMLGNWSFGDYGKREAISWAWELITEQWQVPRSQLWATVHTSDDEAEQLWLEVTDVDPDRILRFDADNFWEMADTGPCGPCAEIHFDRGTAACDRQDVAGHSCQVNGDCARYLELWNLVFIQYNRDASGALTELPVRHVDTGMGLERMAAVMQGVGSNYECDLLRGLIRVAEQLSGVAYGTERASDISLRVIADHARAGTFLVADGVIASNEGRGYVLRRLLRRAARHGKLLGLHGPFLHQVAVAVVETMGDAYPDLRAHRAHIADIVRSEEERFAATLDRGLALLDQEVHAAREAGHVDLPGAVAFKLYDTYGFPLDLTEDILRGEAMGVARADFDQCMEAQRSRARKHQRFTDVEGASEAQTSAVGASTFVGDRTATWESEVRGIRVDGGEWAREARDGAGVEIVVPETPFYPEGGGQVGDAGVIETADGGLVEVSDTQRIAPGLIVHCGRVTRGAVRVDDRVRLAIDAPRRHATRLNHSATHVLHAVLRETLGTHVRQAGSLVSQDRLRFDINHFKAIDDDALSEIEMRVNSYIRDNAAVTQEEMSFDDATRLGALAFFGDKYGDRVRVVRMGEFSTELCGGTHVARTGDIGLFTLRTESGVAAGTRRIEAITGEDALQWMQHREALLREIATKVRSADDGILDKIERVLGQHRELEKRVASLQERLAGDSARDLLEEARDVDGVRVLSARIDDVDADGLRGLADQLRDRLGSGVIVLGAPQGDRVLLVAAVTADLAGRVHAGQIIKRIAPMVGGGGGGRPDFAQAGGRNAAELGSALAAVPGHVRDQLGGGASASGAVK